NWTEAEKTLREAVAANPKHAQAWGNLGLTLGHAGRYQESLEAFNKSVSPAESYANLGMILAQQHKLPEAKEALQKGLELDPKMEQIRRALASLEHAEAQGQRRVGAAGFNGANQGAGNGFPGSVSR